jgi:hypothetical protein
MLPRPERIEIHVVVDIPFQFPVLNQHLEEKSQKVLMMWMPPAPPALRSNE